MSLFSELRRRNVFKVAVAYLVVSWLLLQVLDVVMPFLDLPLWVGTFLLLLIAVGFPFAVIFAWAFELTPDGIKREKDVDRSASVTPVTGRKLDFIIIGVLSLALVFFAVDKFLPGDSVSDSVEEIVNTENIEQSIAVLPFVNMSSDPEQEFFSDGITEEILNTLVAVDGLKVTGRTSSFAFKGKNEDLTLIGEQLGVATILEGSVRKSGNRIRITAQLIKADDGFHLWSETYDRELVDIFEIQEEIAAVIAERLRLELGFEVEESLRERRTDNMEAYALFLRAGQFQTLGSLANNLKAIECYRGAVRLDPDYVPALVGYANACFSVRSWGVEWPEECIDGIEPSLRRAIELEPASIDALLADAYAEAILNQRPDVFRQKLQRALDLERSSTQLTWTYAYALAFMFADYDFSYELFEEIFEREPLQINAKGLASEPLMRSGRVEEARKLLESVIVFDPEYASTYYRLGYLHANYLNDYAEGIRFIRKNLAMDPGSLFLWTDLVTYYLELDDLRGAQRFLNTEPVEDAGYLELLSRWYVAEWKNDDAAVQVLTLRLAEEAWAEPDYQYLYTTLWFDDLQRADAELALDTYARVYPNLVKDPPVVGYWNHGAAITLSMLRRTQGDEETATLLLDGAYAAIRDDKNAFVLPGVEAIQLLQGKNEQAIASLRKKFEAGSQNGWFFLERSLIFEPLWDEPEFKKLMSDIKAQMELQRAAVQEMEENGDYDPIPERL